MDENLGKNIVSILLAVIVGVFFGYSLAYHDVITGCDRTHVITDKQKVYSCIEVKP